ncbi:MAG: hypothetical protein IJD10_07515, partial [Clostridia bacterium]|nr:hypothetical protein [Clostridia bacterium]
NGEDGCFEGVVTGCGSVDGRPVFVFVQDYQNGRAAFTAAHGKKICALYDAATRAKAPVVGVFAGAGAKLIEGIDCLSAYGAVMAKSAQAKAVIPQIAVLAGTCGGASAVLSEMFDFTVADKDAAKRYILPHTDGGDYPKLKADLCVASAELSGTVRALLNYLPSNSGEGTVYGLSREDVNVPVENVEALVAPGSDVKALLRALADDGQVMELAGDAAPEMVCAMLQLNGRVIGAVANQPAEKEGKLTAKAAKKATRFLDFLGRFSIPVLTLVNTEGFGGKECCCYGDSLAKLATAYLACASAKVTVVTGKAYGSAFTLMGSKKLGADLVFALDSAVISVLPPETAVEFVWDDRLREADDPASARISLRSEWESTVATPLNAARSGDIDDIIAYEELKQRIAAGFEILG